MYLHLYFFFISCEITFANCIILAVPLRVYNTFSIQRSVLQTLYEVLYLTRKFYPPQILPNYKKILNELQRALLVIQFLILLEELTHPKFPKIM